MISNASRWSVRKNSPDRGGAAEGRVDVGLVGEQVAGLEPDHEDDLDEERGRGEDRRQETHEAPPANRRVRAPAEVGDHEEEHHHHGAGVDEHLSRRDELGGGEQEEDGERGQVADQRERREERVRERDDRDRRAEARRGRDDPDRPDEDVAHQELDRYAGIGVS